MTHSHPRPLPCNCVLLLSPCGAIQPSGQPAVPATSLGIVAKKIDEHNIPFQLWPGGGTFNLDSFPPEGLKGHPPCGEGGASLLAKGSKAPGLC